jgi:ectoine hydroxylase
MKFTADQVSQYRRDGYVFVEGLIPDEEIAAVRREIESLVGQDRPEVILEADGKTVRSVLNAHLFSRVLDRLCRNERIVEPTMQLLDSPVYIFQSIFNVKRAFDGQQWQWHQDYPTYKMDDKMPEPQAVNALVFIDDVNNFNGPLMMVPGSQLFKMEMPEVDTSVTTYPHGRYPSVDWVKPVMATNGIVAPTGRAGSVVFMDIMTVHGSAANMSPWHRSILSLTLNSTANKATGTVRGRAICHDYTPIVPARGRELLATASA